MESTSRLYRVRRDDISFLRFILEAYDGLAVLTTQDPRRGTVRLAVAPGGEGDLEDLLAGLRAQYGMPIDPLDPGGGHADGTPCS
jgi:hypothetical protein